MMCLDWERAGIDLYGPESGGTYAELDFMIVPCNMRLTNFGAEDDRISPECKPDLADQIKYLGPMNMLIYYNEE